MSLTELLAIILCRALLEMAAARPMAGFFAKKIIAYSPIELFPLLVGLLYLVLFGNLVGLMPFLLAVLPLGALYDRFATRAVMKML